MNIHKISQTVKHFFSPLLGEGSGVRPCFLLFPLILSLTSCSAIDEDLTDCGKDYTINYTVHLTTSLQTSLETELSDNDLEREMAELLKKTLSPVFTDHVSDLDLSFFQTENDPAALAYHNNHLINAAQQSFTLYLPVDDYRHVALANTSSEPQVDIKGSQSLSTIGLQQQTPTDTIPSHSAGLFTARLDMDVEDKSQEFSVDLYMANATAVFVIDHTLVKADSIWGCVTGMATSFDASDSTYTYTGNIVRCETVSTPSGLTALYATGFPTQGSFHIKAYVKYASGKIDEIDLECTDPLQAGECRIIKSKLMNEDGDIEIYTKRVAVSVTLDWKPGGQHDIEI